MKQEKFDVVVIGSGIGGMCSGALLAHKGYRTLVIEKLPAIGGRCSTLNYKGCKIPTGVVGVPSGGVLKEIFDEVGAEYDVRPMPPAKYLVDGKEVPLPEKGQFRAILTYLCQDEAEAGRIIKAMRRADTWESPSHEISLRNWLLQYTSNEKALALFQDLCAAYCISNAHETSAQEFFLSRTGMMRSYGQACFVPNGSIALMESLAKAIRSKGGEVWTRCQTTKILANEGTVTGVQVEGQNGRTEIAAKAVISNAGAKKTVSLTGREHFDDGYLLEVDSATPALQMWITTVSDRPLYDWPMLSTLQSRRMLSIMIPTLVCPELAPAGKHLAYSISGPHSQTEKWDLKEEVDLHVQDLKDNVPLFEKHGEIVHVGCYWDAWPTTGNAPLVGYRRISQKTPIENLYNVGDSVGPPGWQGGSMGCAKTARIVVEDIEKRLKPGEGA